MIFLPGMEREKSFMDERIYENKSLKEVIDDISDPRLLLTDQKIINLIVKYFYAYRFPESISERVKLQDLEYIFDQAHRYFRLHREKKGKNVRLNVWDDVKEFKFFQNHIYATSMLWDIAATTKIVREISMTLIDKDIFWWNFISFDLWSGSGILSLATFLSSQRNSFDKKICIWMEKDVQTWNRSQQILDNIAPKSFYIWTTDTTDPNQLLKFKAQGQEKITFITNETFPSTGISMWSDNDPFHFNNRALWWALWSMIIEQTSFFPAKISMILKWFWDDKEIIGDPKNKFFSEEFQKFEKEVRDSKSLSIPKDWNIFHQVYPNGIELGWKMIPLHEIGDELYKRWLLKYLPDWRHRWTHRWVKI